MKLEKTSSKAFKSVKNKNQKNTFSRDRQKSSWPIIISGDPFHNCIIVRLKVMGNFDRYSTVS